MYRRFSALPSRTRRPQRGLRQGFTLVELLVVITIIAMLVGLLVPAVMAARNAARKTQCMNNQQQLGKGILQYVTTKEKFPPLFSLQPNPATPPPPVAVGWVPPILSYIEQTPMYTQFQNFTLQLQPSGQIDTLVCPSANPSTSPAPLSYVVNGGTTDSTEKNIPMDYQENAVFFDDFTPKNKIPATDRPKSTPPIDIAYLSTHDGAKHTIMLTENMDARDWYQFATLSTTSPPFILNQKGNSWWNGIVWTQPEPNADPLWGISAPVIPGVQKILNQPTDTTAPPTLKKDALAGRPYSNHSGGFYVTFCDGRTEFMSEEIEYRVYCLLMAPDSNAAKYTTTPPGNTAGDPVVSPKNWHVNNDQTQPLKSLNDADLAK